ncbi:MAG: zf-HC2 domain-containing protein [Chloroflexota bacterium]|nr:zf-HC2 domain-containing protein [Chloroflexota bacterium]
MNDKHVTPWLGAYHDGELHGRRLRQATMHLAHCAACRGELKELQALTTLLQDAPAAETFTSPDRFVAQVGLRLPRRPAQPAWKRALETGWRLAPLGLFGAWIFVQVVFIVSGVLRTALRLGLGGDLAADLLPVSQRALSLTELLSSSGASLNDVGQAALRLMGNGGPLGWGVTLNLISLVVIGLLYWSWLASWWARRQHHSGSGRTA